MRLSHKLGLTVAGVLASYALLDAVVARSIVYPSFEALEQRRAADDVVRVDEALTREIEHLDGLCHDWAAWDDSVRFVAEHDQAYVDATLTPVTLSNAHLDFVYYVARDGRVVDERTSPEMAAQRACLAGEFPSDRQDPDHPLHTIASSDQRVVGFLPLECGVFLVSARPIVPSNGEGAPVGSLLMARRLGDGLLEQLAHQTRVAFRVARVDQGAAPVGERATALGALEAGGGVHSTATGDDELCARSLLRDVRGRPWALLEASVPREISAEGRRVLGFAQLSMLAVATLALCATLLALRRLVVAPLSAVSEHAGRVGAGGDLAARLASDRTDEIGDLSRSIDGMVAQLAESRGRLVDLARLAGRSEVATEVLHNVGSVLNSANVAAQQIETRVRSSRGEDVGRLAELLRSHADELEAFLARDERGRQVPAFVDLLGRALAAEREALLGECRVLEQSIDHMRVLVQAQQQHAAHRGVPESVELSALVDLALVLTQPAGVDPVHVVRRFDELPRVTVVRHRLLEILVNVIQNARESLAAAELEAPRLEVGLVRAADGRVRVEVRDNGLGIAPEDLTRVFSHGFTTKPDGHGFGLHSSANAARELGGTLQAESAGPGRGATFVLELPSSGTEVRAA